MKDNISASSEDKMVTLTITSAKTQFFGMIKTYSKMSKTQKVLSYDLILALYENWTENFESLSKLLRKTDFNQKSLKPLKDKIFTYRKQMISIPPGLQITAVCFLEGEGEIEDKVFQLDSSL